MTICGADEPAPTVELATCSGCGKEMERPAATIKVAGEYVPVCTVACIEALTRAELARIACVLCEDHHPCPPADRLEVQGGFACAASVIRAGLEMGAKTSITIRRSGPRFRGRR